MPAIEKKITWTTKSGKHVEVRISFATSRVADADGDRCEVPCCELHIAGEVQGMGVVGYAINRKPVQVAGTTYPATIGKLVIPAVQLAEIDAVMAEVYATPEWQANERAKVQSEAARVEYEAAQEKMRTMMGY